MAELIEKEAFIEDLKSEITNLAMNGLKGTPRDRSDLYDMIDRINEQPTITEAEIRTKELNHFANWMYEKYGKDLTDYVEWYIAEQLKGE